MPRTSMLLLVLLVTGLLTTSCAASTETRPDQGARRTDGPVLGADVSWPQCRRGLGIPQKRSVGAPMPLPRARFVVVGLTNGPGFTPNPCLADQVAWVRSRHLRAAAYAVLSWPDAATVRRHADDGPYDRARDGGSRLDALGNTGYQQARFVLAEMRRAGLPSPIVWLDVEPVPDFAWSRDRQANAAVVRGAARGLTDGGVAVGAYSTQALWRDIVGPLRLGVPEWRPAGETSRAEAVRRCADDRSFQGGRGLLAQWLRGGRDHDVTCPGAVADLERLFHQF